MKKIGLLTWHYYSNFGSMLQTHATYTVLKELGYDPHILNYRNPVYGKVNNYLYLVKRFLSLIPYTINRILPPKLLQPQFRFSNLWKKTDVVYDSMGLQLQIEGFYAIVCGSDQIWAPNVYNPIYMLDFVPDNIRKISYAASIGLNSIPKELVSNYKKYIGRIDSISVREYQGKKILENQCGIKSEVVLDPTLLVDVSKWKQLSISSNIRCPFIFCYFLRKDHQYRESVEIFAKQNNLALYGISDNPNDASWMNVLTYVTIGPREFLGLINDAQIIITDSYHGTIFSLLLHKDFITIERFESNDNICQNSRIEQLVQYFGISKNIISVNEQTELTVNPINYENFEEELSVLREKSIKFLRDALS